MPEQFDPDWEYRTDDPEIAEAMEIDSIVDLRGDECGFRFGSGNPDRFNGHLSPTKPEPEPKPEKPKIVRGEYKNKIDIKRLLSLASCPDLRVGHIAIIFGSSKRAVVSAMRRSGVPLRVGGRPKRKEVTVKPPVAIGNRVRLVLPENPLVHGVMGDVIGLEEWGAHVATETKTGRFRAAWHEMELVSTESVQHTGYICIKCQGSRMIRAGACLTCLDCGESSGCS